MRPNLLNDLEQFHALRGSHRSPIGLELSSDVREAIAKVLIERRITMDVFAREVKADASGLGKFMRKTAASISIGRALQIINHISGYHDTPKDESLDALCWKFLRTGAF
jgi:hypothetical protein